MTPTNFDLIFTIPLSAFLNLRYPLPGSSVVVEINFSATLPLCFYNVFAALTHLIKNFRNMSHKSPLFRDLFVIYVMLNSVGKQRVVIEKKWKKVENHIIIYA